MEEQQNQIPMQQTQYTQHTQTPKGINPKYKPRLVLLVIIIFLVAGYFISRPDSENPPAN